MENLLQPDDSLLDTEIDTETPCTPKPAETEQLKQREDDHGHRVTARHKAFNAHLCFPFENRSQSLKEIEQFMDRGGNGRRVPA